MYARYLIVIPQRIFVRRFHITKFLSVFNEDGIEDTKYLSRSRTKVAIFFGYIGTNYRGLQIQPNTRTGTTVEYHLKNAFFRAGCIHPRNMDNMHRIKWNRSSRTDAGVHALSTVCSARLLLPSNIVENLILRDGGSKLVNEINQYLPKDISVFGFSKVTRKWRARRACNMRTYYYYLSPYALGMSASGTEIGDLEKLEMFKSVLSTFEGRRPFHNFIGNPSRYSYYRQNKSKNLWNDIELYDEEEEIMEDEEPLGELEYPDNESVIWIENHKSLHPKYHIGSAHFRFIEEFTCSDLQTLHASSDIKTSSKLDHPFFRVSITGTSFMLHQIRYMIGTAIAVVNGAFPIQLVESALLLPLRLQNVPMSPAEPLVLAGCSFSPRYDPMGKLSKLGNTLNMYKNENSMISAQNNQLNSSDENLSSILSNKNQFQKVLEQHLEQFIQPQFWNKWLESNMSVKLPSNDKLSEIYSHARRWKLERPNIRLERKRIREQKQMQ